ncbi:MAG: hypothetical protein A3F68_11675 [Acidobacteria bacterium RIFCSPLOWO2_12_FULL_54_10]|nr:MAG: hypothetical protein A3F68_11675 [Acidobacteria bacterium RIFCSPLOWO2_12_FULL_54_10]
MNWIQELFTKNIVLKFLSLVIAIAIWGLAGGNDPVIEATLRVPIAFRNLPAGMELMPMQTEVQIRVRGPSRAVRQASPTDFSVQADLQSIQGIGERSYTFHPEQIQSPTFVEVVQVIPGQVQMFLDQTATAQLPVEAQTTGDIAQGWIISSIRVQPPQVTVAGPRSRVGQLVQVFADPVDLAGLEGEKTFTTSVYSPDPLVRLVEPLTVDVVVSVSKSN